MSIKYFNHYDKIVNYFSSEIMTKFLDISTCKKNDRFETRPHCWNSLVSSTTLGPEILFKKKKTPRLYSNHNQIFFFRFNNYYYNNISELCHIYKILSLFVFFVVFDFIRKYFYTLLVFLNSVTIFVPLLQDQKNFCKVTAWLLLIIMVYKKNVS